MFTDTAPETLPPIIVLVGPTAVGKSRLGLLLAREFDADIVTADSRQVYRYMDIGTAKATHEERARVRHYLLDLVAPNDVYSAQRFQEEALRVLRKIGAESRRALIVGGTGFYIHTLMDGAALPMVPPDDVLRTRLRAEAAASGPERLHDRLADLDPRSAARIHPHNTSRVIRALEVVHALGHGVPAAEPHQTIPALYIGLQLARSALHEVANRRVIQQIQAGLVDEARSLLAMGYDPMAPALQGFGYREMIAHIQGKLSLGEAVTQYQIATRRYIRRQETWFRRDSRITWLEATDALVPARTLIRSWLTKD